MSHKKEDSYPRSTQLFREFRRKTGLTQVAFAKQIKVSEVLISMIEAGQKRVSPKLLKKIWKMGNQATARNIWVAQMDEEWRSITK